jgi:hypothetical protein
MRHLTLSSTHPAPAPLQKNTKHKTQNPFYLDSLAAPIKRAETEKGRLVAGES